MDPVKTLAEPPRVALAPVDGTLNVTVTFGTGLPEPSVTMATTGFVKAVLIWAVCPTPLDAATVAGAPAVLTSEKLPGEAPAALATTLKDPAMEFARMAGEVAWPVPSVDALVVRPPLKLPLAPELGAVNVTVVPETELPNESFTLATSGREKGVLTVALWGAPVEAVTVAAPPGVLVSENVAGVSPETVPVTM